MLVPALPLILLRSAALLGAVLRVALSAIAGIVMVVFRVLPLLAWDVLRGRLHLWHDGS